MKNPEMVDSLNAEDINDLRTRLNKVKEHL